MYIKATITSSTGFIGITHQSYRDGWHRDGRVTIEYGTFAAPYSLREIRAWLGY